MDTALAIITIIVSVATLLALTWLVVKLLKEWLGKRPKQEFTNEELKNNGALFILNGGTSKLCIYEEKIEIIYGNDFKTRFFNMGNTGNIVIPFTSISGFQFLEGSPKKSGRFDFSILGGQNTYNTYDNIFTFNGEENETAIRIRDFITDKISKSNVEKTNKISKNNIESTISNADEIAKYKKLLDDGIITQEEFETKKKQLLNI